MEEGIAQAKEEKADVVVICSSDTLYPSIAPQIMEAMEGKAEIVVAGYPKDDIEQLQGAGIKHFIHVKTNILETLQKFNDMLL